MILLHHVSFSNTLYEDQIEREVWMDIGIVSIQVDGSVPSQQQTMSFFNMSQNTKGESCNGADQTPIFGYSQATALFPEYYKQ